MFKPFIIAECGCNHQGKWKIAKEMITVAATYCKVNVVKFQKRTIDSMPSEQLDKPYLGPQSFGKTYREHREALEFELSTHCELASHCHKNGVEYSCSVWDLSAAKEIIGEIEPVRIKIPSAANMDFEMMDWICANYDGEIHLSLGMTTWEEKQQIFKYVRDKGKRFVLYHCTSAYPLDFEDVYLADLIYYEKNEKPRVEGYSGHHRGIAVDVAAMSIGCRYIERHFTLNRDWPGTDHAASLEPDGLRRLVRDLNSVAKCLATKNGELAEVEKPAREKLRGK